MASLMAGAGVANAQCATGDCGSAYQYQSSRADATLYQSPCATEDCVQQVRSGPSVLNRLAFEAASVVGAVGTVVRPQSRDAVLTSDYGAAAFAERLHRSRGLYHDRGFRGPEVVYKSPGVTATNEAAIAAWLRSKRGHKELIESGKITAISCVGTACVGRGAPLATRQRTTTRSAPDDRRFLRRLSLRDRTPVMFTRGLCCRR